MPVINQVFQHIKQYGFKNKTIYVCAIMVFFFSIYDGILEFITPIAIIQNGFSNTAMGLIISSSSLFGILFDLILYRLFKDFKFRRIFLAMFGLCALFPLILWQAKTFSWFILAMAVWGMYYDLFNIGNLDLVSRRSEKKAHAASFGIISIFWGLGYLLGPLISGFLIKEPLDSKPFIAAGIFLGLMFISFLTLIFVSRKDIDMIKQEKPIKTKSFFNEIRLWRKIGNFILPVLMATFIMNISDAFFWTIGPVLSVNFPELSNWGGLFMMAYILPWLFVGGVVSLLTKKFGKKHTAFSGLIIGSIFLLAFPFIKSPFLLIIFSFLASCGISIAWPALSGAYADYVSEVPRVEKEIVVMKDGFGNMGFIIGPVLAGLISDLISAQGSFAILGLMCLITAIILWRVTPKHINIKI